MRGSRGVQTSDDARSHSHHHGPLPQSRKAFQTRCAYLSNGRTNKGYSSIGLARDSRKGVVGRSITHIRQGNLWRHYKPPFHFLRWPATGPFFEYRFGIKQFEKELLAVGLSILEVTPIDAISGMFYEFGTPLVSTPAHGGRSATPLGRVFKWIFARAPWAHAHMLLFVVRNDDAR
jgi:hypothetical protein